MPLNPLVLGIINYKFFQRMISHIRITSKLVMLAFILFTVLAVGCKSKKKAMEASNAAKEKAKLEQEAANKKRLEEEARKKEAEEAARRDAEARSRESEAPKTRLNNYFAAIASAANAASANNSINEALSMFASPDTPVLIVISEENDKKDFDRPTTIKDYLHYLKDQKKNTNLISILKVDSSGKITEVELKKPL
jgi:hypothetical protein